jgi:hypothetical protein
MMTSLNVVLVPIPITVFCGSGNNAWARRSPQPQYPCQPPERWPLHQSIPTDEARQQLDSARRAIASERAKLQRFVREGQRA